MAASLNFEGKKVVWAHQLASDGFYLNLIDLMLILCKPFMSDFQKYPTFIGKINCFYLATDDYFDKASALDKIEQRSDKIEKMK
jgi:hypothetical protein